MLACVQKIIIIIIINNLKALIDTILGGKKLKVLGAWIRF